MFKGHGLKDLNWQLFAESLEDRTLIVSGLPMVHWSVPWYKICRFKVKKHWIGTDVLKLKFKYYRLEARIMNLFIDEHCFVCERLLSEFLKYFPNANISFKIYGSELLPYREKFNILTYLPKAKTHGINNDWLYGRDRVDILKARFPEANWMILDGTIPANMIDEIYKRSDLVLRLTRHDGDARMVIRAHELGIPCYWSETGEVDLDLLTKQIKSMIQDKEDRIKEAKEQMLLHG